MTFVSCFSAVRCELGAGMVLYGARMVPYSVSMVLLSVRMVNEFECGLVAKVTE